MRHTISRPLFVATAGLLLGASGAFAQSPCGASYQVERGDTLYSIAQSCRVALARIMDLNPALGDPRDIAVGTELQLQADSDGDAPAPTEDEQCRVREGDTLYSIAEALGVSLIELISANENVDPTQLIVGNLLEVPGDEAGATVTVSPDGGTIDQKVIVRARNLRPNDWVTIGAGERASEWRSLREVQVGPGGDLSAEVDVPDWPDANDDLIFVVDTDRGVTFKSGVFDVVAAEGNDGMMLEGRVRQGTECDTLRTPDGDTWSLVSDTVAFTAGEYVEVEGSRAEVSICMEGVGTLDVQEIRHVEPPARDRDPGRAGGVKLDEDYVVGAWAAQGGDCDRPDFEITRNDAGGTVVETSVNGDRRTGYVQLGPEPQFIFDQPRRDLPLQSRGPDGLAVMPPADGPVTLGGLRIEGDGRVFVKCG